MVTQVPILKDRYEAIIIGAGMGGLATASVLAHEGLEVLVLERAHQPGGCCSSFQVGDFTFDAAASVLSGFGTVGFHIQRTLFDFLGQQADLVPRDSTYLMHFGDKRVEFHRDRHSFTAELGALFPQTAGTLYAFLREMEHIYEAFLDCGGPPKPSGDESALARASLFGRHSVSSMRLTKYARTTAERVFDRNSDDKEAKAFFDADLSFWTGYRLASLSATHAALALIDRHIGGTHHPIGSTQQLPNRLEKSITELGGRIEYGLPVERVVVEEGRAAGVVLADGKRIGADVVVSDTSARDLYENLVPSECVSPATRDWLDSLEPGLSVFAIYLGLPAEALPEDFHPTTVVVDDPVHEPERFISVNVPSLVDPYLSPEGYHSVTVHAVTDPDRWPSPSEAGYRSEEYEEAKRDEAARVLARMSAVLGDIAVDPVVWRIASPATFERILARDSGGLTPPLPRGAAAPASMPGTVTEVPGLFLAGDSTFFGSGVANAAASGLHAGLASLRYLAIRAPRFNVQRESLVLETVPVRPEISGQGVVDSISAVCEALRCVRCRDAPCVQACPAGVDIPNVNRRMTSSDFSGAARLIRNKNPLGEVCGIVCPAGRLCEAACARAAIDSPVRIAQLEEFACGVSQGPEGWPKPYRGNRRDRVAVIGSGPAGLSCAYYLSLMGFNVEVFEKSIEAGGLPAHAMADFRLNRQLLEREMEGTLMAGVEFRGNTVFGEDIDLESLLREDFRAVFLAMGLPTVKMPSVRGIDLPGVIDALSFLEAARRKVKRELTQQVAVIGEGTLAVDTAILARRMGARTVYLVTGMSKEEMAVETERLAQAAEAGVTPAFSRKIIEIKGEGRVEALRTHPLHGAPGEQGAGEPASLLEVGTVIVAGDRVSDPALSGYFAGHLKTGDSGLLEVNEWMMTSRPGVFAGGDLVGTGGLVVEACAAGRRAAIGIAKYLEEGGRWSQAPGPAVPAPPGDTAGEPGSLEGDAVP